MKDKQTDNRQDTLALMFVIEPDGFMADLEHRAAEADRRGSTGQQALYQRFQQDPDQAVYDLAFAEPADLLTPSSQYLAQVGRWFLSQIAARPEREFLRHALQIDLSEEAAENLIDQAPFLHGMEHLSSAWLRRFGRCFMAVFAREIQGFGGTVADYLAARRARVQPSGRVYFHLVENKQSNLPFAFMATYAAGVDAKGQASHLPLANALQTYRSDRTQLINLLATVNRAAEQSVLVKELLDSGEIFQPIGLTAEEAYTFLQEIPLYETSGIICRMPDWWKRRTSTARVSVSIGDKSPTRVGLNALVDFNVHMAMGDLQLTAEELNGLLREAEGLVLIKGRWIEVNHARLQAVLQAYEDVRQNTAGLSLIEAMRLHLQTGQEQVDTAAEDLLVEIEHGEWLQSFLDRMSSAVPAGTVTCGEPFLTRLRPYQLQGLNWLWQMKALGLGACLADDMGLGKTVQVIALLNGLRADKSEKSLLVVPASLIGNWRQEIARFAPALRLCILHPTEHNPDPETASDLPQQYNLLMTTYGMLDRYDWLKTVRWDNLILDEAQAIKNPATRQTRAVKRLDAAFRIALTGTPIENRLSDLWSLFDFLNQGLLGPARSFALLARRLQERQGDYARLKQVLAPFILRRLKTDKTIIADLPDKIEMKTYAALSQKQLVLYSNLVTELEKRLAANSEGIDRKGLILASIMKLKQICNHPDQYLGQQRYRETESGKFARLREICETIYEKRERVLIFTQFREITGPLQLFLAEVFAHEGLVLHGGTPVNKRRDIVAAFQGTAYVPFMVLSLKAGGVGLNLTAANHVIHFDRWWNPAVENQATDRVFRIGQQKNVIVHKFLTSGTIEEKIDQLIAEKSSLVGEIIAEKQETWITEMDNRQLMNLFQLSL